MATQGGGAGSDYSSGPCVAALVAPCDWKKKIMPSPPTHKRFYEVPNWGRVTVLVTLQMTSRAVKMGLETVKSVQK